MNRRIFLQTGIGLIGFLTLVFLGVDSTLRNKIIGKLKYKLMPPTEKNPDQDLPAYQLPEGGQAVSVEKALNSRCTSDDDHQYLPTNCTILISSLCYRRQAS